MSHYRFIIGLLSLLYFSNVQAGDFSYRYLEILKNDTEFDLGNGQKVDGDLMGIGGALPINDTFFITGGFVEGDVENTIDLDGWSIGLDAHFSISPSTDVIVDFSHSESKVSNSAQSATSDGQSVEIALRSQLTPKLELLASYWADLDDSDDSLEIGGLINLTPVAALGLSYTDGENYNSTTIGFRVYLD